VSSEPPEPVLHDFDLDDPYKLKFFRDDAEWDLSDDTPDTGDRWTSWDADGVLRGPQPYPDWLVTDLAAGDTELGIIKTGKEADVYLVSRSVVDRECLLAAKRYRDPGHRLFHRDAGYVEGRRVRRSRETRAMAKRTDFGREMLAGQWASAEFGALCRLWELAGYLDVPPFVPYPVQLLGTELMLEFIGSADGEAAPRLAQLRPPLEELTALWRQLVDALVVLARGGYAHGDLSAFNLLVHDGRLVLIDLPQVVDVVANPQGPAFLRRDVHNVATWFAGRGLSDVDAEELTRELLAEMGLR